MQKTKRDCLTTDPIRSFLQFRQAFPMCGHQRSGQVADLAKKRNNSVNGLDTTTPHSKYPLVSGYLWENLVFHGTF